jgi:hypothetical protein
MIKLIEDLGGNLAFAAHEDDHNAPASSVELRVSIGVEVRR